MSAVVVRDLPPVVHRKLKQEARRHHRSMNREIIAILEKVTGTTLPDEFPPLVKPLVPVDGRRIADAIRTIRDSEEKAVILRPGNGRGMLGTAGKMRSARVADHGFFGCRAGGPPVEQIMGQLRERRHRGL